MLCLFSEISFFPLEILVGGCGSVGGFYREITHSKNHLDYYIQEPSAILFIWNTSGYIKLQLHNCCLFKICWINFVSYYGWWYCISWATRERKNTKIEKISWEFFKTSSCNEKEKSQKWVSAVSQKEFMFPCLPKLLSKY